MKMVQKHHTHMLWPLIALVLLTGCNRDEILGVDAAVAASPTVTTVTPADNATGVALADPGISATFSEPMTTDSTTFSVTCEAPCTAPNGTVALNASNTQATFTLAAGTQLLEGTSYTATVAEAESLATGLPLKEASVWSFTTVAASAAAPTVTAETPLNNATQVSPVEPSISATFSEPMAPMTDPTSFTVTCEAPCTEPTGTVSLDATNTVATFTLAAGTELLEDTSYTVTVNGSESLEKGLSLEGASVWSFITAARPSVVTETPLNNATQVSPVEPSISATFSEPMAPMTDPTSFTVTCEAPCTEPTGTVSLDATNTVATFTLAAGTELLEATNYAATVTGVESLETGLNLFEPAVWIFTTASKPRVTAVAPVNNATGVPINNTVITADFTEPMAPLTGDASFTVTCEAPCTNPAGTVGLDASSETATFTLATATTLEASTLYTATVTVGQSLSTGLTMTNPFIWSFTTGVTLDTTRPRITLTEPVTSDPGPSPDAPTNTSITAAFTEDMTPSSITNAGTFSLVCDAPCVSPAGDVSYSVGSKTMTFSLTPAGEELEPNVTYMATISTAATDLAGNALAGNQDTLPAASDYIWTFTTLASIPPADITVIAVEPLDNDIAVCPDATINATFDVSSGLQLDPASIDPLTFTLFETVTPANTVTANSVVLNGADDIATFTPQNDLIDGIEYTATVKGGVDGVKDLASPANTMVADFVWSFIVGPATGDCLQPPDLGAATPFAIAANAGVTNTPTAPLTTINGDVVLDPVSGAICNNVAIDAAGGFGLCAGSPPTLNGQVISPLFPDAGATSGAIMDDLQAAFLSITPPAGPPAAGSLGGATNLPAGTTLGAPSGNAMVQGDNYFVAGVYQSLTSIMVTGDLTLDGQGNPNAVFIFQSSSSTGTAAGAPAPATRSRILLIGGAKAVNVFWQTGTSATLGAFSEFQGNILASESITMETGASACGRLLAGAFAAGAFVFDSNLVSVPGPSGCP